MTRLAIRDKVAQFVSRNVVVKLSILGNVMNIKFLTKFFLGNAAPLTRKIVALPSLAALPRPTLASMPIISAHPSPVTLAGIKRLFNFAFFAPRKFVSGSNKFGTSLSVLFGNIDFAMWLFHVALAFRNFYRIVSPSIDTAEILGTRANGNAKRFYPAMNRHGSNTNEFSDFVHWLLFRNVQSLKIAF